MNTRISICLLSILMASSICCAQQTNAPVSSPAKKGAASEYGALIKQAGELRTSGYLVEAGKIYDSLIQRNRNDIDALIGRGFCRLKDDAGLDGALEDFNKVMTMSPSYADAYIGAAICHRRRHEPGKLESVMNKAESLVGADEDKRKKLAESAWVGGLPELARRLDDKYKSMVTADEQVRQEYVALLTKANTMRREGYVSEAAKIYEELIQKNNADIDALIGRGFCRLKDDAGLDGALEDFNKVMTMSPSYADAYIGAAICHRRRHEPGKLESVMNKAESLVGSDADKRKKLAESAWVGGLPELARRLDDKYKSMVTADEQVRQEYVTLLTKANTMRREGYVNEAAKIYEELIQKNRNDIDALVGRGFCRLKDDAGLDGALEDFNKVMILSPSYTDAYVGAAICLKRKKDPEALEALMKRAESAVEGDDVKRKKFAESAWSGGIPELARRLDKSYESQLSNEEQARKEYVDLLVKARTLRADGKTDDAMKIYGDLIQKNTNDVDAICGMAFCLLRDAKKLDEALAGFHLTYAISPDYLDAYLGAAACYRRKGDMDNVRAELEKAEKISTGNEKRVKYLAATAWREGHFQMGRRLDDAVSPDPGRILISNASKFELEYGHSWLEVGDDWDQVQFSYSQRLRPDISISAELDNWWRYGGEYDWSVGLGGAYRHNYFWAASYYFDSSDADGYLARQKHSPTLYMKVLRRTTLAVGPRFANYGGEWSEKLKLGLSQYVGNWFAEGVYTFGSDTKEQDVSSWSLTAGYTKDLRYAIIAGYSSGEETVEFFRNDQTLFRTEDVESYSLRGAYYLTETFGLTGGLLHEFRESDLFRRELKLGIFKNW